MFFFAVFLYFFWGVKPFFLPCFCPTWFYQPVFLTLFLPALFSDLVFRTFFAWPGFLTRFFFTRCFCSILFCWTFFAELVFQTWSCFCPTLLFWPRFFHDFRFFDLVFPLLFSDPILPVLVFPTIFAPNLENFKKWNYKNDTMEDGLMSVNYIRHITKM